MEQRTIFMCIRITVLNLCNYMEIKYNSYLYMYINIEFFTHTHTYTLRILISAFNSFSIADSIHK